MIDGAFEGFRPLHLIEYIWNIIIQRVFQEGYRRCLSGSAMLHGGVRDNAPQAGTVLCENH